MAEGTWKPGDRVCYRPKGQEDDIGAWEWGTVIREGRGNIVFVRFDLDRHAKACYQRDLHPEFEKVRADDGLSNL